MTDTQEAPATPPKLERVPDAPLQDAIDLDMDADEEVSTPKGIITFKIGGQIFRSKKYFPPAFFLMNPEDFTGTDYAIAAIKHVITKEDRERFVALINDPDADITSAKLDQLAMQLMGKISGRPTVRPTSSGDGPESTETGSKENSSSPGDEPTG